MPRSTPPRLALLLAAALVAPARAAPTADAPPAAAAPARGSARDFDFLHGAWEVQGRRLRTWFQGAQDWEDFPARSVTAPLPGGIGNTDEFTTPLRPGVVALTLRLFDPQAGLWSIYWIDSRRPVLGEPVRGRFEGDVATFEGDDVVQGRKVRVRYTWSRARPGRPHWEQALSTDGGKTWETNWVMDFAPARSAP